MYFKKTPYFASFYYPSCTWKVREHSNTIYLTFDDGPDDRVTPMVIDVLKKYGAKATFFCVGQNVETFRGIIEEIRQNGHGIGNHSYSHVNGFQTSVADYISDMNKCKALLNTDMLRPPYGKITRKQIKMLKHENKIVMWSVLPGDFDRRTSKESVLKRAICHTGKGDIIVFHDNIKFRDKMLYALEGFLDHFSQKKFLFKPLSTDIL